MSRAANCSALEGVAIGFGEDPLGEVVVGETLRGEGKVVGR